MNIGERPAFPVSPSDIIGSYEPDPGMTYRQWLAGMVLQGLVARPLIDGSASVEDRVEVAISYADALIEELSKPNAQLDA
jgi:hypothetical protein